jgi:hypothetical protein
MIYQKRGKWCIKTSKGIMKFPSQSEAMKFAMGSTKPEPEIVDAKEEDIIQHIQEEVEEEYPEEQEALFFGEIGGEEEI